MILTRTKKIITYGPSLDSYFGWNNEYTINDCILEKYNNLINSGVDCIRFNMSHDNIENHEKRYYALRKLNKLAEKKVSILIDTKGPEIRVGTISNSDNLILKNDEVIIKTKDPNFVGNNKIFAVTDSTKTYDLCVDLKLHDLIYIADGKLVLKVIGIDNIQGEIRTISQTEKFNITSNRRLNLIDKKYHLPFISDYDLLTIKKAIEWKVDFLALSFLSNINQLQDVKNIINDLNKDSNIKLIGKIENLEALNNIDLLILNCDGIMVARGDLALEIGYEKVPYYEDVIVSKCIENSKISIVATQVLDSLENSLIPTRAETYDCYNIVKLGANAVMLSGETASSIDPLNSVIQMNKIISFAENINFNDLTVNINFKHIVFDIDNIEKFSWINDEKIGKFLNANDSDLWMTLLKKVYFIK